MNKKIILFIIMGIVLLSCSDDPVPELPDKPIPDKEEETTDPPIPDEAASKLPKLTVVGRFLKNENTRSSIYMVSPKHTAPSLIKTRGITTTCKVASATTSG